MKNATRTITCARVPLSKRDTTHLSDDARAECQFVERGRAPMDRRDERQLMREVVGHAQARESFAGGSPELLLEAQRLGRTLDALVRASLAGRRADAALFVRFVRCGLSQTDAESAVVDSHDG